MSLDAAVAEFDGSLHYKRGFTLIELLVTLVILAILIAISAAAMRSAQQEAHQVQCTNNLRQFAAADIAYFNDTGQLPPLDGLVPSSITQAHLSRMATYLGLPIPSGPVSRWPKRPLQPSWYNCPMAQNSGYAEGLTLGGGVYTGYEYLGGVETAPMVTMGEITVLHQGRAANARNTNRGVLWTDVLGQFTGAGSRSYECFHIRPETHYSAFVVESTDIEGIHRAWSDGSVEWVPAGRLNLTGSQSPDAQLNYLGSYIYYY